MSDLRFRLARLDLSQYSDAFISEGFDTWATLLDITESDLSHLNVKLGHRRKLQRAFAEYRGQSSDHPLSATLARATSVEGSLRSNDEYAYDAKEQPTTATASTAPKRKYRRHPKPDEHAPERPPSAYVIFSAQVREHLKGQDLSFTKIAKVVGERWQVLPPNEREACERQANLAKEKYYSELAEYKKTPYYETYQKYLEDFKMKHAASAKEGKRMKLETQLSNPSQGDDHDNYEQAVNHRLSPTQLDPYEAQRSGSSPPVESARLLAGPSSASYPLSGLNSPLRDSHHSSVSASPRSAMFSREGMFDLPTANLPTANLPTANISPRNQRPQLDTRVPHLSSVYPQSSRHPASTTPPPYSYMPYYQATVELPSRRPLRDSSAHLPSLTRDDTTWSSKSSHSGYNMPVTGCPGALPYMDQGKSLRLLPQPVPTIGQLPSPLDRPLNVQLYDSSRMQGPMAALVRASELHSREADDAIPEDDSP